MFSSFPLFFFGDGERQGGGGGGGRDAAALFHLARPQHSPDRYTVRPFSRLVSPRASKAEQRRQRLCGQIPVDQYVHGRAIQHNIRRRDRERRRALLLHAARSALPSSLPKLLDMLTD